MSASQFDIAAIAALIRAAARDELLPRFRGTARQEKADGSWVTEADLAMQVRVHSALATAHPEVEFLGEEMDAGEQQRLLTTAASGLWVLDPLDGTNNYAAGIPLAKTTACIDFKRLPPPLAARIAATPPYASQRSIGSVALDWCWVAAERFHLYLHGRQNLWDYAAGRLILEEAGGYSDTLDGGPAPLTLTPRSAACAADPLLFAKWLAYLRSD